MQTYSGKAFVSIERSVILVFDVRLGRSDRPNQYDLEGVKAGGQLSVSRQLES